MARVVSVEEGASGVVKTTTAEGSLFVFRTTYLEPASFYCGHAQPTSLEPGAELDEALLSVLIDVMTAEHRAVYLLARAEQFRKGLERKLLSKKLPSNAVGLALDRLESEGLLSDFRYAEAWIRQRVRRHPEGPRSVSAALASKGVSRDAIRDAVAAFFTEARRFSLLSEAARLLRRRSDDSSMVRSRLFDLGWRSSEISEYLLTSSSDA